MAFWKAMLGLGHVAQGGGGDVEGGPAAGGAGHGGLPEPNEDESPADAGAVGEGQADSGAGAGHAATAVLAGGCFWCVEAVYQALDGVSEVVSGYAGGDQQTADYHSVCTGKTGHAEAVRVRYEPAKITYGQLLRVFFGVAHDPTQHHRQGPDVGPQYRSAIFYANDQQRRIARAYIDQLDESGVFGLPIATSIEPLEAFYPAEDYHQDFYDQHPNQPYARSQIRPKLAKLRDQVD